MLLKGSTPKGLHGRYHCGPPTEVAAPQQVSPEPLGSQGPPA
jgi:hypothetical protein